MATATQTVKESLIGATLGPELSQLTKATFNKHARKDEATGELYMTEGDFVDAIAPKSEDYVSGRESAAVPMESRISSFVRDQLLTPTAL